ncbi:hypothetical protein [Streptomyces sp. NPDC055085]
MGIDWDEIKRQYPDGYGLAITVEFTQEGVSCNVLTEDTMEVLFRIVYHPNEAYRMAQSFTMAAIQYEAWRNGDRKS